MHITYESLKEKPFDIFDNSISTINFERLSLKSTKTVVTTLQLRQYLVERFDLENHPEIERIDLNRSIPVYDWHINLNKLVRYNHYEYLEKVLTLFKNYYQGFFENKIIRFGMHRLAQDVIKNFVGVGISEIDYRSLIESILSSQSPIEFWASKYPRYFNNPYFTGKKTSVNRDLGQEKRELQSSLLEDYLSDYDYNQGKITYKKISQDLNISERTVIRYLKDSDLRELYDIVKANSKR